MRNILILSNNAASYSESNGRTHINYLRSYLPNHVHNFYLRGNPDIKEISYFTISNKKALLSKLSLGLVKLKLVKPSMIDSSSYINKSSSKSKYIIFHLLRNYAYSSNRSIYHLFERYIIDNAITDIMIWGCNIPFLYEFGYKLTKNLNLRLSILTGEDYPLKDYNYLSKNKSLFFKYFQHKLFKKCKKAYSISERNIYANDELKNLYETTLNIKNGIVLHFPSLVSKVNKNSQSITNVFYGGNLYKDRVNSILEIADHIKRFNNVKFHIYGRGEKQEVEKLCAMKNIIYHGEVSYEDLLKEITKSDLLIHVEGFSKEYINDCRYAFSTKIGDYYMFNIPFFIYGSNEISGVNFAYNLNSKFVATNKKELAKLDDIIEKRVNFDITYDKIISLFNANIVSRKFEEFFEK